MTTLGRISILRRDGTERFRSGGAATEFDLIDFWRWCASDLVTNTMRGLLAEYIVARALQALGEVRDGWAPFDLATRDGIKVEVKSCSYLQSWHQTAPSAISFSVKKSRAWDANTNQLAAEQRRQADVYVFALLAHQDKATLEPLDIDQWEFYVLPTRTLDSRTRSQHSISLSSLRKLEAGPHAFAGLATAVAQAHVANGSA